MKPNFALTLNHDSISLLHRTARGWLEIGGATLDAPDMDEALSYLRRSALGLSPAGITTKLVIPNSEILYDEIEAPGPDAASRRAQITKALRGRTPYNVEDLVFDWQGTGPVVKVAVVARSTLTEAEDFAARSRFNPVSFVAMPTPGSFGGEPWFGTSSLAADLLPKGTVVERDQDPISIVAREMPHADPAAVAADAFAPAKPVAPAQTTPPKPENAPKPAQDTAEPARPPKGQPSVSNAEGPNPPPTATDTARAAFAVDATAATAVLKTSIIDTTEKSAPEPGTVSPQPVAPSAPPPAPASFATRRDATGRPLSALSTGSADKPSRLTIPPSPVSLPGTDRPTPISAQPAAGNVTPPIPPGQARMAAPAPVSPHKPGRTQADLVTASGIAGLAAPHPKPAKPPMPPAATPTAPPSAKRGLDGLAARATHYRGRPRFLGLILTGVLLLILALIAAWSSYYISTKASSESGAISGALLQSPEPIAGLPEAPDQSADQTAEIPAIEDEMLADQQDPEDFAPDTAEQQSPTPGETPADTDLAAPAPAAQPILIPAPAPATTAIVESGAAFGPTTLPQDEIFLATMDAPPPGLDALALPHPDATPDSPPAVQPTPPPFGTEYQFDENGMIQPTAAGIVTPDGVRLVAGRPAKIPPARPLVATSQPLAENTAAQIFPSDPAMAGFRPRNRPTGLAPAQPGTAEDAALPEEATRFAGLRPRARPSAAFALAESARRATLSASTAAATATQISPLAVAVSRRPTARPASFSKSVEAAVAAAIRQPAEQSTHAATDAETEAEPESKATAAPRIPTRASVAKNATFVSAINLSKTNLIGVYGTSSSRYALIRQSNGRYKKVKVGDKVEGGVVAAITADELRYQKSGKIYALTLPEG